MDVFEQFKSLTSKQRSTIIACFLGWTLDAFDFFILVFVIQDIAKELGTDIASVTFTLFLTLAMRPLGAFLFGVVADRYGRRRTLMANILFYSFVEFACGFAPSLTVLIVLRAVFGIAMGGEWGVGAALTMETVTPQVRGFVSGLLQAGYPTGYLLVTIVYWVLYPFIGWRGMFMVGVLPALLVLYVRTKVEESPAWLQREHKGQQIFETIIQRWPLFVYMIVLMTVLNFFSHGTEDLYPTFLQVQRKFPQPTVAAIAILYNIGAILGALCFGTFSERIGRRSLRRGTTGFADHSPLGFRAQSILAGSRGFRDAVPGPGSLGCNSGSPERTLAFGCSRHVSRFYLSTWKSFRCRKCNNSGGPSRTLGQQLCSGHGDRGRCCGDCRSQCHRVRSGSKGRRFREAGCHGLSKDPSILCNDRPPPVPDCTSRGQAYRD
jgi:MFS family permease